MSLAISYSLNLNHATVSQAREMIISLHKLASNLPFIQIGEIVELEGNECLFQEAEDPHLAFKVCALTPEELVNNLLNNVAETSCCHLIGFNTLPGQGCNQTSFGLATHQSSGQKKDWFWKTSCKTQYANNPEYGGIENFLKCHLLMIKMLESATQLDMLVEVTDPSGYWQERDPEKLIKSINEETFMLAAIMGTLKDSLTEKDYKVLSPIFEFPNFEYLEAKGTMPNL